MAGHRHAFWREAESASRPSSPLPEEIRSPALATRSGSRRRSALGLERDAVRRLLEALGSPPIRFVLWDGTAVAPEGKAVRAEITLRDRATLWRLLADPELHFGEAYSAGRLAVKGDLVELMEQVLRAPTGAAKSSRWLRLLHRRPRRNTLAGSRQNIHRHYDLGNDFYRLWLDDELLYTCAYFASPEQTLEEAQRAKMEHVCRKLQLQPGERVVEAGSGWGALALYMAREHGVSVRSYNISHEQVEYARRRLRSAGLADRVEFIEDDYRSIRRSIRPADGEFDVFVSVGMLEHVGKEHYHELGGVMNRVLGPQGRGLVHTIGRSRPRPLNPWIERYIFPGAYPPTLSEMMEIFEPFDLAVLDVENLRLHYAETLRHWLQRYEGSIEQVREMFDEPFVRAWRLYLSGSIAAFACGTLQLYQVLVNRAASERTPMTRSHLYQDGPLPPWSASTY